MTQSQKSPLEATFSIPLTPIRMNLNNFKQIVISDPKICPGNENVLFGN
jgi:hypothetical protein